MPPIDDSGEIPAPDIDRLRAELEKRGGPAYWRSLEELSETPEFRAFVEREFPADAAFWDTPVSRRGFLKVMSGSLAMAFFAACRRPAEYIVPYNKAPEDMIPGRPVFFASALPFKGYGRGVLVETHMGRPLKIEGNPLHPDTRGATDVFMQAAVLDLYDPDRSQAPVRGGIIATWGDFRTSLEAALQQPRSRRGAGLRVLTETVTSPSLGAQLEELLRRYPEARWHQHDPAGRDAARAGALMAFGRPVETRYAVQEADVIVSLDADFFIDMPGSLGYARGWADRRQPGGGRSMNRLYAAEACPSVTGTMADNRLPFRWSGIEPLARALAAELGTAPRSPSSALDERAARWVRAAARDLVAHPGRGLVIPGETQTPAVHALAHAMNRTLRNAGRTVSYSKSVEVRPLDQSASFRALVEDMGAGKVEVLLILGGNPAYTAPADLSFADALSKVPFSAHLSPGVDETSDRCLWHLPEAHPLESWGDLRASDGTVSIVQPQIAPLYEGKSPQETLSLILDETPLSGSDLLRAHWKTRARTLDFEGFWRKTLSDGVMAGTELPTFDVPLEAGLADRLPAPEAGTGLELVFKPDPCVWDGRYANNAWLQELPRPVTKITWDNAALVSPALAGRLGVRNGDVLSLRLDGRKLEAPAWITPGHADGAVTVTLGYGRTRAGRVGEGMGFNAYALRGDRKPWGAGDLTAQKTGREIPLAATHRHHSMEGRDLVRAATLAEFSMNPRFAKKAGEEKKPETLYTYSLPPASEDYAWGMAVDLNLCIGCNACVIACQAENNIPVVGKEQVAVGREMHWLRVDRYHSGGADDPVFHNQPVPCMHCEHAPCEPVCPVGATNHSEEGLNQMVYNRCVGTRYCSNNCPYKVRRFNFLAYTKEVKGPLKLLQNPDVTVRSRGVMEKCTYCVQRIQQAKITAEKEDRLVRDGEIIPACAQACPTRTILFGNLKDRKSQVSRRKEDPRDYALLAELGTRPRTTYQARIRNPNPSLPEP